MATFLRLNPYYELIAFTTPEDGPDFPLRPGELVAMELGIGTPIAVTEAMLTQVDLKDIRAPKMQVNLLPIGEETGGHLLSNVSSITTGTSYALKFSYDLENVLVAILTDDQPETQFPFQPGQVISVPLTVRQVMKPEPALSLNIQWYGSLIPAGTRTENGLIETQVERVE